MVGSPPLVAALIAVVLLAATFILGRRLATEEGDVRLLWLVMLSTALRFICTLLQGVVVKHAYGGVADYTGYVNHGATLAAGFGSGNFSLGAHGITSNGSVDTVTGVVFTIIGDNEIGAFLIFSWLASLGLVAFYRAFRVGVPEGDRFRYAVLLFLLPSLLFWTSAVGKEALMTLFLGVATHGAARMLMGKSGGLVRFVAGLVPAAFVRPHEALLLFGAFVVGFLLRRQQRRSPLGTLSKVIWLVVFAVGGYFLLKLTASFLHISSLSANGLSDALHRTNVNNGGTGAGFGSSGYRWSSSPLHYPQDVYTVLFSPLPFQAHSLTQLLASAENTALLAVLVASLSRLRGLGRALVRQPFVAMAFAYTVVFLYLFAALGNLGLLDRERTLLFPLLLVMVALPRVARRPVPVSPWAAIDEAGDRTSVNVAHPMLRPTWR